VPENVFSASFFAVDKRDNHFDAESRPAGVLNRGNGGAAGCNDIVDNGDFFAGPDIAFDGAFGAVIFNILLTMKDLIGVSLLIRDDGERIGYGVAPSVRPPAAVIPVSFSMSKIIAPMRFMPSGSSVRRFAIEIKIAFPAGCKRKGRYSHCI